MAVAMATAQVAVAESWRINNDISKGAHFVDINAAMASELVKDGDVLYLDPGCLLSNTQTITKAVTVIGTGWDFNDRPYTYAQISGQLFIRASAAITGVYITNSIPIQADNIIIERCLITSNIGYNSSYGTAQNLQIRQCYISGDVRIYGAGQSNSYTQGWGIYNNVIVSSYAWGIICDLLNATISNNYIYNTFHTSIVIPNLEQSVIKNNIIVHKNYIDFIIPTSSTNELINNCLSASADTWAGVEYYPNNTFLGSNAVESIVVNSGAGGSLARLCEGSPAIGAGEGGIDCGPYAKGSLYPFVTYGMPKHIPYFTEAVVPAQPTDGKVKVSLKIVNQND